METTAAIAAFGALANETRLAVFQLLINRAPESVSAGDIAEKLNVAPSTLSHHLAQLDRAGLIFATRFQRHKYYAADLDGTRALLNFLTSDCCGGNPDICNSLDLLVGKG